MHFTTALLTALLASTTTTQARLVGFYAPQNAAPGSTVKIEMFTESYIQSISDVAVSFGLAKRDETYLGALGRLVGSKFLGRDLSNVEGNITHYIDIPADFPTGPATLQAAHFSLTGASVNPTTEVYYANVTIGEGNQFPYVTSARVNAS